MCTGSITYKDKAMRTIYKYPLQITDEQLVSMPAFAEILTVQLQDGKPVIWAYVETTASQDRRLIETFGTGNPITNQSERKYIGTYQLPDGLVFHVFEYLGL
jgi:hypothetical protein